MSTTTPAAAPAGATVRMRVELGMVGPTLHEFEQLADVHIVDRSGPTGPLADHEVWSVRSDRFPREWEGWWIHPTFIGTGQAPEPRDWKAQPPRAEKLR